MDSAVLLKTARANRLAICYTLLTLVILAGLGGLSRLHLFEGAEGSINAAMHGLADHGRLGMFAIGLLANVTLIIQVPYNLPMFSLVIHARSVLDVVALGVATGLGAGIGVTISFRVATSLFLRVEQLQQHRLVRLIRYAIARHPRSALVLATLVIATPVPDFTVIIPLGLAGYSWKHLLLPTLAGKVVHNVVVALLFRFATDRAARLVSTDINFEMTAVLLVIFFMVIFYQIAKARAARGSSASAPEYSGTLDR